LDRRITINDQLTAAIGEHFASLEDPRVGRTKRYQLFDIIVIALCAIICGADDWVAVALFGNAKLAWLSTFLDKSNEITALPILLRVLELAGCVVTIDALGCQTEIAQAIVERDADYVLAVKENQGQLYEDITGLFAAAQEVHFKDVPHDADKTTDKDHGRMELRQCWTIRDTTLVDYLRNRAGWRNLRTIIKVVAERRANSETTHEVRYFISSLDGDARRMRNAVRGHWVSKTRCTGCSTSPSMKITSDYARTMARRTW
jgi:predicted transposase YbfD/YdcC